MASHPLNPKAEPAYGPVEQQRMRHSLAFFGAGLPGPALDIGPANDFGRELGEKLGLEIVNTEGDLDFNDWRALAPAPPGGFPTIWCFEVIEHLMNPLLFLTRLRDLSGKETRLFVTYPLRPRFFWSDIHWHEIDRRRFRFLVDQAGWKVERYREVSLWREPRFYLTGIRPFLRMTIGKTRSQMFELTVK